MQIQIPVIPAEGKLTIPEGMDFVIETCSLLEVDREISKRFLVTNEMAIPNVFQRTIYFKGPRESLRIGMLMVDLIEGLYTLKVDDVLTRPAGLDIQLSLKLTTKE